MSPLSANPDTQRKPTAEPRQLDAAAQAWMERLPAHLQPKTVAVRFPRILNRVAKLWPENQPCRAYLEDLLLDTRGDRQGFPVRVAVELALLKSYYESHVFPTAQTVWDELAARIRQR